MTFLTFGAWNFKISNQSKREQSFAVNFWKHQKRKKNLTKYIETGHMKVLDYKISQNSISFLEILVAFIKSCNMLLNPAKAKKI